jgi:hypothetical protein
MMSGIEDFKVVADERNTTDPWFKPSGLVYYQETPLRVIEPNPRSVVLYVDPPKPRTAALDRINLRRLFLMLWNSRRPLPDAKISRRSRRRWRGQGGVWLFDDTLWAAFKEAAVKASAP